MSISVLTPITVIVSAEERDLAFALVLGEVKSVTNENGEEGYEVRTLGETGNLRTPLSPTGELPATHYMSSGMWMKDEIEAIWNCMIPSVTITEGCFVEGDLKFIKENINEPIISEI